MTAWIKFFSRVKIPQKRPARNNMILILLSTSSRTKTSISLSSKTILLLYHLWRRYMQRTHIPTMVLSQTFRVQRLWFQAQGLAALKNSSHQCKTVHIDCSISGTSQLTVTSSKQQSSSLSHSWHLFIPLTIYSKVAGELVSTQAEPGSSYAMTWVTYPAAKMRSWTFKVCKKQLEDPGKL